MRFNENRGSVGQRRRPSPSTPNTRGVRLLLLALLLAPTSAQAGRWGWSGSVAMNHTTLMDVANPAQLSKPGATVEWALKTTVDVSDRVTIHAKLCTSCHGLSVDQAYAEIRMHPLANLEAGRINVPFGDYYLRHDPVNDVLASKPLPYAMGHMLRFGAEGFNLGVIPMPYTDQGASLFGNIWIKDTNQVWYALYAVNGFRSGQPSDFDFKNQVADVGWSDNNDAPSWGARLNLARDELSIGASYLRGAYDPEARYAYDAWGVDFAWRLGGVTLRSEYLERETEVRVDDRMRILDKRGFFVQTELSAGQRLTLVGRLDGLLREGPRLRTDNEDDLSGIVRLTLGLNLAPSMDYSLRLAVEHWRFTDFADVNVIRLGTTVAY